MKTIYRNGPDHCIVPMELRAVIIEGYWTPRAAKQAVWAVWIVTASQPVILKLININPSQADTIIPG
ncbi:hypothetical protein [Endozoicomonas euniceicola]|uniref:Uncharacterized protein n=1 Tax=Endozoicomonas euniceicola TaxID=1234143 RepID=A0ABY6GPP7_9GAMM|nr:hypothetical protein [Endozoicomonas euniceicola]UYM14394.1 hypothetical protein NX720_15975 [Endozoicomonas euniceicola]